MKFKLIVVTAVILAVFGGWCWFKVKQLNDLNARLNATLMQKDLALGKANTRFGNAEAHAKDLDAQLQAHLKSENEWITQYGILLAKYNAQGGGHTTTPDTQTEPAVEVKCATFGVGRLYLAQGLNSLQALVTPIEFKFSDQRLEISTVITPAPANDHAYKLYGDVNYKLHLSIMAQVVQTTTKSGAINNYVEIYEVDDKGNKLGKFELTKAEFTVKDQRVPHLMWWAPHLDVAVIAGFNGAMFTGGSVGFSVAGYGLTENDLSVRFPRIGFTMARVLGLDVMPVTFNVGETLPLLSNVWIGPFWTLWLNGASGGGVQLGVVL
jgi:hypothetical protein